jgi:hypothetical protein
MHGSLFEGNGGNDPRLVNLHTNVRKIGTISNTVAEATRLEGPIRRKTRSP